VNLKESTAQIGTSLRSLLEAINNKPAGIAFITDESEKLCGVVTDGDFRRMLLNGKTLETTLGKSDFGDYVFAKQGESVQDLVKKSNKKVRTIPIVDYQGRLVDFFRYDHRVRMIPVAEPDLRGKEYEYLSDAFLSTWISSAGKYINQLEDTFANYCGVDYGVAVSNGTVALHLALKALKIGEGDEVIIPDLTFAATANAVLHAGATPVLVDIEPDSWCIDPSEIEKAITTKTKAIIPVHVYGQPCDMEAIMGIAAKHGLKVIEDAAEAHGAEFKSKRVGSFGDIACFSFFGNKIITTGEGGICVTNSNELNERMRLLRDHGMSKDKKYWHEEVGYNYRMTNLQASIGCAQLERIEKILESRDEIENTYVDLLSKYDFIEWQPKLTDRRRVVWLVCALIKDGKRDIVMQTLRDNGVDVRPFFYPLHEMPVFESYHHSSERATQLAYRGINLPTINNVEFDTIAAAFEKVNSILKNE
jgi:perosamine synthetase